MPDEGGEEGTARSQGEEEGTEPRPEDGTNPPPNDKGGAPLRVTPVKVIRRVPKAGAGAPTTAAPSSPPPPPPQAGREEELPAPFEEVEEGEGEGAPFEAVEEAPQGVPSPAG